MHLLNIQNIFSSNYIYIIYTYIYMYIEYIYIYIIHARVKMEKLILPVIKKLMFLLLFDYIIINLSLICYSCCINFITRYDNKVFCFRNEAAIFLHRTYTMNEHS